VARAAVQPVRLTGDEWRQRFEEMATERMWHTMAYQAQNDDSSKAGRNDAGTVRRYVSRALTAERDGLQAQQVEVLAEHPSYRLPLPPPLADWNDASAGRALWCALSGVADDFGARAYGVHWYADDTAWHDRYPRTLETQIFWIEVHRSAPSPSSATYSALLQDDCGTSRPPELAEKQKAPELEPEPDSVCEAALVLRVTRRYRMRSCAIL
jgi:hypothetical protein